jgi:hypothetical protein
MQLLVVRSHPYQMAQGFGKQPGRFAHEDRESRGLKIRINECDEFTRRTLTRALLALNTKQQLMKMRENEQFSRGWIR